MLLLPEAHQPQVDLVKAAIKQWLARNRNWLFILDDADDLTLLDELLPPMYEGHMLLTTHRQTMEPLAQTVELRALSDEEGAHLLLRRAKLVALDAPCARAISDNRELAAAISHELGGLPLALEQAGAYILETQCNLAVYRDLYHRRHAALLERRGERTSVHKNSLAASLSLSLQLIEAKNTAASDLLRLCAFFHPDAIPEAMILQGAPELDGELGRVVQDAIQFNETLQTLLASSLIHRHPESKTLTVHRLVQVTQRDNLDQRTQRQWTERAVRIVNRVYPSFVNVADPSYRRYLRHALACANYIEELSMSFAQASRLLHATGAYLYELGHYHRAELLLRHALTLRQHVQGDESQEVAETLRELGRLAYRQGQFAQAERLLLRSLTVRERLFGDGEEVAEALNDLGVVYYDQAHYEQAEQSLLRALQIRERAAQESSVKLATTLNDLAWQSWRESKETAQRRSSSIARHGISGNRHLDLSIHMWQIAYMGLLHCTASLAGARRPRFSISRP